MNPLRLFLWLVTTYDLTGFKVLSMPRIIEGNPHLNKWQIDHHVAHLVACGLLEAGPLKSRSLNTYRINPSMLATPEDLRIFFEETKARAERESLMRVDKSLPRGV